MPAAFFNKNRRDFTGNQARRELFSTISGFIFDRTIYFLFPRCRLLDSAWLARLIQTDKLSECRW